MKLFSRSIILLLPAFFLMSTIVQAGKDRRSLYQLTVYQYASTAQEKVLNNYLQNALLPALHRAGFSNIGVFKSLANDTATVKLLYVFLTIKNLQATLDIEEKLNSDIEYQSKGTAYINAAYRSADEE